MSRINVTPLVDVMLVLLIVFMIAAPLLTVGVPVDLPESQARPLADNSEPLTITIDVEGDIFLQETRVEREQLVPRLLAIGQNALDQRIYIRGDTGLPYGRVMEIMGAVNAAGFNRVALVTQPNQ